MWLAAPILALRKDMSAGYCLPSPLIARCDDITTPGILRAASHILLAHAPQYVEFLNGGKL